MSIDKLFINGSIYTMTAENQKVEAMGVKGDKIAFVGSTKEALEFKGSSDMEVVDLYQRTILPGLTDSHLHLYAHCKNLEDVNLETARSINDVITFMKNKVSEKVQGKWIKGANFDDAKFIEGRMPTKTDLDKISTTHPIIIRRVCLHVVCANSLALKLAGIVKGYQPEVKGTVEFDGEGEPTGIVRERSIKVFDQIIPDTFSTLGERKEAISKVLEDMASKGLTSVHTYAAKIWKFEENIEIYRQLEKEGSLPIRVLVCLDELYEKENQDIIQMSKVSYGSYKIFIDGSLGARSAALLEPYSDDPGNSGILLCTQEELYIKMRKGYENGMQLAMHAIGDMALDAAVTSIEEILKEFPYNGQRFRIIHAQLINGNLLGRMKKLPIVLDIQPRFLNTDLHWLEDRLGKSRSTKAYTWKTMMDEGIILAGGSDSPVESYNPFKGVYCAITRQNDTGYPQGGWHPEEKLSVYQALSLFTKNSAYTTGEETIKGTLEPGKLADFIMIDRDPFIIEPLDVLNTKVLKTFVGGIQVY
ncbi:MAG TPA: amidohydrolase [Desulfosporosinus sp.]|nr:amidohydrolase [Desulfosporosinus sp.]